MLFAFPIIRWEAGIRSSERRSGLQGGRSYEVLVWKAFPVSYSGCLLCVYCVDCGPEFKMANSQAMKRFIFYPPDVRVHGTPSCPDVRIYAAAAAPI